MSKNEFSNGDFVACVPHQIEADWDEKWGPLLAGFPVNIMYACELHRLLCPRRALLQSPSSSRDAMLLQPPYGN
jgi:hypothetical protein